jgi:hypothetical protein
MRFADTAVRIAISGSEGGPDFTKDVCTGLKRVGDVNFQPWRDEFCPTAPQWVCDFSGTVNATFKKPILAVGSYFVKPGNYILRLPGYFADKEYATFFAFVRGGEDTYPPAMASSDEPLVSYAYGKHRREWLVKHSSDAVYVRFFDISIRGKTAIVYPSKDLVPTNAAQLYVPEFGEFPTSN